MDVSDTLRKLSAAGSLPAMDKVDVQLVPVPFPARQVQAESFSLEQLELVTSRIASK